MASHADNLLSAYRAATPEQRRRGREWYDAARAACADIARDTGVALERVAAVLAITSPDSQLVQNIAWTRTACESGGGAGRYPRDQKTKVAGALNPRHDPSYYVRGPKVSAFYRAILGDQSVLVIDRWAAHAAGEPRDRPPNATTRAKLETAYTEAAASVGESVRDFQAIVWIQVRETTRRADGRLHRYWDFDEHSPTLWARSQDHAMDKLLHGSARAVQAMPHGGEGSEAT